MACESQQGSLTQTTNQKTVCGSQGPGDTFSPPSHNPWERKHADSASWQWWQWSQCEQSHVNSTPGSRTGQLGTFLPSALTSSFQGLVDMVKAGQQILHS